MSYNDLIEVLSLTIVEIFWKIYKQDKIFNNGPGKICGRQSLKNWKDMTSLSQKNLVHSWILFPNLDWILKQLF